MSSSVCQGLQSCLEPSRLVEPRVLIQNLALHKSTTFLSQSIPWLQKPNAPQPQQERNEIHIHDENNKENIIFNNHRGCYSFVADASQNHKTEGYVRPLVMGSSSKLSKKSLEMCTESLGSETGSSIGKSIDDFPSPPPQRLDFERNNQPRKLPKKPDRSVSFPPPLTSISGSDGVQMRPHRENGRLVLKAVSISSCSSYFQAERTNGRLRLSLLKDGSENNDSMNVMNDQEAGEKLENAEGEEPIHSEDDELEDAKRSYSGEEKDMEGNGNVEKIGVGELPRRSRCNEGGSSNKGIPSWRRFWVLIS